MAEERIIDDDLDRNKKYKIRKNSDGEDELYIDDSNEVEVAEIDETVFDIPEFVEDDEEAAVLTPEQLATREEAKRQEEERKRRLVAESIAAAEALIAEGDFDGALYHLNTAENTDGRYGGVFALKIKVLTRNFTDFTSAQDCVACAECIKKYCTAEQKAELAALSEPLKKHTQSLEEQIAAIHVEVEEKKSERRIVFMQDRKKWVMGFTFTVIPFLACLIMAISFSTVIHAELSYTNLILTIIFAALAFIFFIATVFTARKMWAAMRKVSLNEKNSATRLGREYEELVDTAKKLNAVLLSFNE